MYGVGAAGSLAESFAVSEAVTDPGRARHLMLGEALDAASAGYRVGYDDAAYFSREYKSLFGLPPMRDVERLRESARRHPYPVVEVSQ
jgi:hypothetical protein